MKHPSTFTARPSIVSCELDGGTVLLDLDTSRYFGLNAVGLVVWEALAQPSTADELCRKVCERFDVSPQQCAQDVDRLLFDFMERRLIERGAEPVA